MNRITFCGGESTGSIADSKIETSKKESTGSVGYRYNVQEPEIRLQSLDRDTVSFRGNDGKKSSSSTLGIIAGVGFTAAAMVVGLGCAKKYNWVNKLSDGKFKDFVMKYGTDPCHKFCKTVKTYSTEYYNKAADFFNKKK